MKRRVMKRAAAFVMALALAFGPMMSVITSYAAEEAASQFTLYVYDEDATAVYANIWNHVGLEFAQGSTTSSEWGWNNPQALLAPVENNENWYSVTFDILDSAANDGFTIYKNDSSNKITEYDNQWNNTSDYLTMVSGSNTAFVLKDWTISTDLAAAGLVFESEPEADLSVFTLYVYSENVQTALYADIWGRAGLEFTANNTLQDVFGWGKDLAVLSAVEDKENWYSVEFSITDALANDGFTIYRDDSSTKVIEYDNQWNNTSDYLSLVSQAKNAYASKDGTLYLDLAEAGLVAADTPKDEDNKEEDTSDFEWLKTDYIVNGNFETGDLTGWTATISASTDGSDYGLAVQTDSYSNNNTTNFLNIYTDSSEASQVSISQTLTIPAGKYKLGFAQEGAAASSGLTVSIADMTMACPATTGWENWATVETDSFELKEETEVTLLISGSMSAYWGKLDDIVLYTFGKNEVKPAEGEIGIKKVDKLPDDFINGMDVSTIISEYNSGVVFYDDNGTVLDTPQKFFDYLATKSINYIRVRVWVDPFNAAGEPYGAGICDLNTAKEIGKCATNAGMKLLVDFHYSDFWCDPGRAYAPKAWAGMSVSEKSDALYDYTVDSLNALRAEGINIGMVQVGNEVNSHMAGCSGDDIITLIKRGCEAVRAVDENYLIVVHYADPQKGLVSRAAKLDSMGVDYDVFGSSYYNFWHGTLANLTKELKSIATTYDKLVMVAETSYVYTLTDTDGQKNGISTPGDLGDYSASVIGQATALRDVIEAVANVGNAGIGVFYWEPAWIAIPGALEMTAAERNEIWAKYGSGWASKAAIGYDGNVSESSYGGSEWDIHALFDATGHPLPSINTFAYAKTGSNVVEKKISHLTDTLEVVSTYGQEVQWPATTTAEYNDGTSDEVTITWNEKEQAACVEIGTYTVTGTVSCGNETYTVKAKVEIIPASLLADYSFEATNVWTVENIVGNACAITADSSNVRTGNKCLKFWYGSEFEFKATQTVNLQPGVYTLYGYLEGGSSDDTCKFTLSATINGETTSADSQVSTWKVWDKPTATFTVTEASDVTVTIYTKGCADCWGSWEDIYLYKSAEYVAPVIPDPEEPKDPEPETPAEPVNPEPETPVEPEKPETETPVEPEKPEIEAPVEPEKPEIETPVEPEKPETETPAEPEKPAKPTKPVYVEEQFGGNADTYQYPDWSNGIPAEVLAAMAAKTNVVKSASKSNVKTETQAEATVSETAEAVEIATEQAPASVETDAQGEAVDTVVDEVVETANIQDEDTPKAVEENPMARNLIIIIVAVLAVIAASFGILKKSKK